MKPRLTLSLMICLAVLAVVLAGCRTSVPNPASTTPMKWDLVRVGDCPGFDVETTDGSIPDDAKARAGYTAICWDNETYTNALEPGKAFCTYKKIAYDQCTDGDNPGEMYTAVSR